MKKYYVENLIDDREQALGRMPHENISNSYVNDYIIAENENDAINIAIDCIADELNNSSSISKINWEKQCIEVYECFTKEEFVEEGYNKNDWDENDFSEEEMTELYECKNCKMKIVQLYYGFTTTGYDEEEDEE